MTMIHICISTPRGSRSAHPNIRQLYLGHSLTYELCKIHALNSHNSQKLVILLSLSMPIRKFDPGVQTSIIIDPCLSSCTLYPHHHITLLFFSSKYLSIHPHIFISITITFFKLLSNHTWTSAIAIRLLLSTLILFKFIL
jgi:hypothetical protein